jgi:enediyne biosynthesis protein E7
MLGWFREHGEIYRVYSPVRRAWTWVITDPDDIKRVLVGNHRNYTKGVGIDRVRLLLGNGIMTSEGSFWRRQRRMLQPAFHRRVVEQFAQVIRNETEALAAAWALAARSGQPVNVTESMSRFTLKVVLQAIFGADLDRLVRDLPDNPFMVVTEESKRDPRFAYEFRQLGRHVQALARERACQSSPRFDFLQMIMNARDPDAGVPMTEQELLDEILTLVVAGHETTASALTWTWWLLSQHPEVEARVFGEQQLVGDVGLASYGELACMPYARQVLEESMRLFPPGWLLTRRNIGPDRLGGFDVPPGTDIFISPYLVHRNPRHWQQPETFDPGHFAPELVEARHAFAYIPFGGGPRRCIGENFAIYEMMLHLNAMVRRFRLVEPGAAQVAMEARINLRTAQDITMRIETR